MMAQIEAPPPPLPPTVVIGGGNDMPPAIFILALLAILATAVIIFLPLMKAWARRIEGKHLDANEVRGEIDELRMRMQELEADRTRFVELEERLDFAERLLAQGQPERRIERGGT
jgi:hypothetical protein